MVVDVSCPHCAKTYSLPTTVMGRNVKCAACREDFSAMADHAPEGMFATRCSHCGNGFAAPDRLLDLPTTCPACRQVFTASVLDLDSAAGFAGSPSYAPANSRAQPITKKKPFFNKNSNSDSAGVGSKLHPVLQIGVGVAMAGFGGIASLSSYQRASEAGGEYTVYTGLIVIGVVTVLAGIFRLMGGKIS